MLVIGLERGTPAEWSASSRCRRRAGLEGCDISRLWKVRRCLVRARHRPPGFRARIWHLMSRCEHVVQIHKLCLCIILSKWELIRPLNTAVSTQAVCHGAYYRKNAMILFLYLLRCFKNACNNFWVHLICNFSAYNPYNKYSNDLDYYPINTYDFWLDWMIKTVFFILDWRALINNSQ